MIEFTCEVIWSWTFVYWKIFNHIFNFITCAWSIFFLFLPGLVLEDFLRICPFLSSCPFNWHILFVVVSYDRLYLYGVSCNLSFFISNFIESNLFFTLSLAEGLSILFIFPKSQLSVSLIFAIVFFISIAFIASMIFMIYFLLLTLGLVCSSFSSCFRCKLGCLRFFDLISFISVL